MLAVLGFWPCWAQAQAQGLQLRSSPRLEESLSPQERQQGSVHLDASRIDLRPDMDLVLQGEASIRRPGLVLRADRIEYDQSQDRVKALGNVRINQQGNVFVSPQAELQLDSFQGGLETPQYQLVQGAHGDARAIEFIDENRMSVQEARYTTSAPHPVPNGCPNGFCKRAASAPMQPKAWAKPMTCNFISSD